MSFVVLSDGSKCWKFPDCRKHKLPVMGEDEKFKVSKRLSYVLRHKPESLGLVLDEAGWVDIAGLVQNYNFKFGTGFTVDNILTVVKDDSKQRYTVDGGKIRAAQGHSVGVVLGLEEKTPPPVLFHGTAVNTVPKIMEEGLKSMSRDFVHLSETYETAVNVGSRHGVPVVLNINALDAFSNGVKFYLSENNVWLAKSIPTQFISS